MRSGSDRTDSFVQSLNESYWPAMSESGFEEITIGDRLTQAAQDSGDMLALTEVCEDGGIGRKWTFAELQSEAMRLARILVARHQPRTRIAIWANNIPEWVLLEYAAAYAGLVVVTLNPSYQKREVRFVLEQSRSTALYMVPSVRGNPIADIAHEVAGELLQVEQVIDMTREDQLFAPAEGDDSLPEVKPSDPAQIQYTSGTTGVPKGALLHHMGLAENARLHAERGGMRQGDAVMNVMPMFHTGGCAVLTLGPLAVRATEVLFAQFDPVHAVNAIESEGITCVFGVPTMITGMVEAQQSQQRDVSTVRNIIAGGSMVAPELVRRAQTTFDADFQIIYGQTETSPVLTMVWGDDSVEDTTQSAGQPLPNVELSVRDTETNEVVPIGAIGEICARGPMTMLEYFETPEFTHQTIDEQGWLHTGDLGTMDERGYLTVTGRVKEMIIRGGENLFPAEIENAMLEHPDLAEVAVVGLPDERWGEIVGCFVRPRSEVRPEPSELSAFCRERISPQKTPSVWVYVDEWPLTGSGKVRKFLLRDQFQEGHFDDAIL